ncbi:hypothetical protein TBS_26230 [Thermobispora bispora]
MPASARSGRGIHPICARCREATQASGATAASAAPAAAHQRTTGPRVSRVKQPWAATMSPAKRFTWPSAATARPYRAKAPAVRRRSARTRSRVAPTATARARAYGRASCAYLEKIGIPASSTPPYSPALGWPSARPSAPTPAAASAAKTTEGRRSPTGPVPSSAARPCMSA